MSRMPAVQNMSDLFVYLQIKSKGMRPDRCISLEEGPNFSVHDIEKQPRETRSESTVVM